MLVASPSSQVRTRQRRETSPRSKLAPRPLELIPVTRAAAPAARPNPVLCVRPSPRAASQHGDIFDALSDELLVEILRLVLLPSADPAALLCRCDPISLSFFFFLPFAHFSLS